MTTDSLNVLDAEKLPDVIGEYLHWRKVNPHIKGGENYLKRFSDAMVANPCEISVVDDCRAAFEAWLDKDSTIWEAWATAWEYQRKLKPVSESRVKETPESLHIEKTCKETEQPVREACNESLAMPTYTRIKDSPAYKIGYEDGLREKPIEDALRVAAEILNNFKGEGNKLEEWQACYAKLFTQMNDMVQLSLKRESAQPDELEEMNTQKWLDIMDDAKKWHEHKRESSWQPIDTAPKDGTTILASHRMVPALVEPVYWDRGYCQWHNGHGLFADNYFTLWQPLPLPPTHIEDQS